MLKDKIVELLRGEYYRPDSYLTKDETAAGVTQGILRGTLQNRHIAWNLKVPMASVRRATRELVRAGKLGDFPPFIDDNRRLVIEYQYVPQEGERR